jgi:hypothetical protein
MTSTTEAYSTYLSSSDILFSRGGTSGTLYVPLVPAQIGISAGGYYNQSYLAYTVHGLLVRTTEKDPSLSADARIGYWNSAGNIVYTTAASITHIEEDLYVVAPGTSVVAIGLPYEDTDRVFTTIYDMYNVSVGIRASLVNTNLTLVG